MTNRIALVAALAALTIPAPVDAAAKLCSTWTVTKYGGYFRFHKCKKPPTPTPSCKSCPGQPQVEPLVDACDREVMLVAPEWSARFCAGELSDVDLAAAVSELPAAVGSTAASCRSSRTPAATCSASAA